MSPVLFIRVMDEMAKNVSRRAKEAKVVVKITEDGNCEGISVQYKSMAIGIKYRH